MWPTVYGHYFYNVETQTVKCTRPKLFFKMYV